MRLGDLDALKEDFKTRLEKAKRWEENAINRKDYEIAIRAKATSDFICEVIMTIDNAPTVEPKEKELLIPVCEINDKEQLNELVEKAKQEVLASIRPQGEWIYTDKEDKEKGYGGYCSVCKCDMPIGMNDWKQEYYESKFCPNCGAYMRGEEE